MERVEELGIRKIMTRKHQSIPMCANVDLYSGLIYSMLEIPEDLYTPLFATARIAGWCAHRLEELATGNRIMRPAYRAMLIQAPYIPVDARTGSRPRRTPCTGVLPFWLLAVLRILILRLVRGVLRFGLVRFVLLAHDEPPESMNCGAAAGIACPLFQDLSFGLQSSAARNPMRKGFLMLLSFYFLDFRFFVRKFRTDMLYWEQKEASGCSG